MRSTVLAAFLGCFPSLQLAQANPAPLTPELPHKRSSLPPITISGNAFWKDKTRFYIRGIDYQPGGSSAMHDPLADTTACLRDLGEFNKLGINTIRVYTVDNSVSHDTCMNALADAGIYVVIDVNSPNYSINRVNPKPSYNAKYLQSVFSTIDAFVKYDNTLAFISGNEVINDINSTLSAVYVKATTRDIHQYIKSRNYRQVPVGYSGADVNVNRMQLAQYMNCGSDDERSDFFAFNDYSWCNTDFTTAGWDQKVQNFTGYGIPIFLSEYGCLDNGRDFGEVAALMSNKMTGVYSGGLVYEYSWGPNNFGMVNITGNGPNDIQELGDFAKYQRALSNNPAPTGDGGFVSESKPMDCPPQDPSWLVDSKELPVIPTEAQNFMEKGAGGGPGLKGEGSQFGGSPPDVAPEATPTTSASSTTATATEAAPKSTSSKSAAGGTTFGSVEKPPFIVGGFAIAMTLAGTLLL